MKHLKGRFDDTRLMNPDDEWIVLTEFGEIIEKFRNKISATEFAREHKRDFMANLYVVNRREVNRKSD